MNSEKFITSSKKNSLNSINYLQLTTDDSQNKKDMNHKDLDVWKKSMDLVETIYKLTQKFPESEKFGLTS